MIAADPKVHVVLVAPEIPQNTGNIGRMCAVTQSRLHLVHPLGFVINDKNLRRAGMDYWRALDVVQHADYPQFLASPRAPLRRWYLTRRAKKSFWDVPFAAGDGLILGCESKGLPDAVLDLVPEEEKIYVDQPDGDLRSLNLATCAGIATYEVLRQLRKKKGDAL